jgi:hypothetical protein
MPGEVVYKAGASARLLLPPRWDQLLSDRLHSLDLAGEQLPKICGVYTHTLHQWRFQPAGMVVEENKCILAYMSNIVGLQLQAPAGGLLPPEFIQQALPFLSRVVGRIIVQRNVEGSNLVSEDFQSAPYLQSWA